MCPCTLGAVAVVVTVAMTKLNYILAFCDHVADLFKRMRK